MGLGTAPSADTYKAFLAHIPDTGRFVAVRLMLAYELSRLAHMGDTNATLCLQLANGTMEPTATAVQECEQHVAHEQFVFQLLKDALQMQMQLAPGFAACVVCVLLDAYRGTDEQTRNLLRALCLQLRVEID